MLNQTNFDLTMPSERRIQAKLAVKDEYIFDFLTVLDEKVKLPDENPFIGIIICKDKDKTFVEYALKRSSVPIGVATYQISNSLPDNMKELLPEPGEIIKRLKIFEGNI